MTRASELLRAEIERSGPIPFRRFMEVALYHPEYGYYTGRLDPFGKAGDFYTAEQMQPVYGILIARLAESLRREMGGGDFRIVELGAGRGEMAEALRAFSYLAVDVNRGELPVQFSGFLFANEFFDALPVHLLRWRSGRWNEVLVDVAGEGFAYVDGPPASDDLASYAARFAPPPEEGRLLEANLEALDWLARIASRLERGYVLAVDYGYTRRELLRFPSGTLMSYRRHTATEDVLSEPGSRDITAHVNFTALEEHAPQVGLEPVRFETLARMLLRIGEEDQFESALAGGSEAEQVRRRLQLKNLLFGMGETFRTLLLKKAGSK